MNGKTLNIDDFIHPEDKAALDEMRSLPGFDAAVQWVVKNYNEQMFHGMNMASKIRLGPDQFADLHGMLPPLCAKLGIAEPEFYLELDPAPNAYTYGDSRVFITVTSGLLQAFESPEVVPVLAHECGHIVCRHVIYHTLGRWLFAAANKVLPLPGVAITAIASVYCRWMRMSEFSADRVAAVLAGNPESVAMTMLRLSGAPKDLAGGINMNAFLRQADAYDKFQKSDTWNNLLQTFARLDLDHPFPAVRAREIMKWGKTETFKRITKELGTYAPLCGRCGARLEPTQRICRKCGTPT